jgi:hypothetical protein
MDSSLGSYDLAAQPVAVALMDSPLGLQAPGWLSLLQSQLEAVHFDRQDSLPKRVAVLFLLRAVNWVRAIARTVWRSPEAGEIDEVARTQARIGDERVQLLNRAFLHGQPGQQSRLRERTEVRDAAAPIAARILLAGVVLAPAPILPAAGTLTRLGLLRPVGIRPPADSPQPAAIRQPVGIKPLAGTPPPVGIQQPVALAAAAAAQPVLLRRP